MIKNLSDIISHEWHRATTLASYGMEPLTIGWFEGKAYIYMWNYKTGRFSWKEFNTNRPEKPSPNKSLFDRDDVFYKALNKR